MLDTVLLEGRTRVSVIQNVELLIDET